MKKQIVVEVHPKNCIPDLSNVNERLKDGWLVKKIVICYENCVHYLLEKEVPDEETNRS